MEAIYTRRPLRPRLNTPDNDDVSCAATRPQLYRVGSHNPPSETERFHAITYLDQSTVSSHPLGSW